MVKKINLNNSTEPWVAGMVDGKCGFVNSVTGGLIPAIYDSVWSFSNGFARVKVDNKVGVIKSDGSFLIEPIFDAVWPFYNGIAKVNIGGTQVNDRFFGGKYGYIKTNGSYLTEVIFDRGNEFKSNFVEVVNGGSLNKDGSYNSGGKKGIIDMDGRITWLS